MAGNIEAAERREDTEGGALEQAPDPPTL